MRKALAQLESFGTLGAARLAEDPDIGLVVERTLALLDDLARQIPVPAPEGPPHVLLQLSLDVDSAEAAAVVARARDAYREYVHEVERVLSTL